jgi:hypothetical protein
VENPSRSIARGKGGHLTRWHARQDVIVSLRELLDAYAYKFYMVSRLLFAIRAMLPPPNLGLDRPLTDEAVADITNNLQFVMRSCEEVRLQPVARYIRTCFDTPRDKTTRKRVLKWLEGIEERLNEHLNTVNFKFVTLEKAARYHNPAPFGQKVADNFSSASFDIEEAEKCRALDRHTASVMHPMRSLEVTIDAIGRGVGVPDAVLEAYNSWERLLKKIDDQIKANDKAGAADWPPKKQFFVEAHAHLSTVKNAWRNPSMHLEKKYLAPEAERIYRAVQDLIQHLAEHLDQSGNFTP